MQDSAQHQTGKSRSQRIQLDYHRQPDAFHRWRWRLATVAVLAVVAYVGIGIVSAFTNGHYWNRQTSTGPLAHAHAAFENNCAECHGDGFGHALAADAWRPFGEQTVNAIEQSCNSSDCHHVSHHFFDLVATEYQYGQKHCAMCHRDHLGRDHDLSAVKNGACINCHQDIRAVLAEPDDANVRQNTIEAFTAESHGEFRSLKDETRSWGSIKFDHFQHMQPGQAETGDGESNLAALSVDQLPAHLRNRYQVDDDGLVQLSCQDCHELGYAGSGWGNVTKWQTADGNLGKYFSPINFERHCRACHALNYGGQTPDDLPLPHAAPAGEFKNLLRTKLQQARSDGRIWMPADAGRTVPVPGVARAPATEERTEVDDATVGKLWDRISARCLQCHDAKHITDEYITAAASGTEPDLIPKHWLRRGSFDHSAHANMDCRFCHSGAYASTGAQDHKVVMIDNIESCTPCHRPSDEPTPESLISGDKQQWLTRSVPRVGDPSAPQAARQATWASDDCITCHRYHWTRPSPASAEGEL